MDCKEYRQRYPDFASLPLPREIWETPEWEAWMDHFHDCSECSDWTLVHRVKSRGANLGTFPCVHIADQITQTCSDHPDPTDCPDILLAYTAKFDEYAITKLSSDYVIQYCPWCGTSLPESKRNRWFDKLAELGFDDPAEQDVPDAFLSGDWYKSDVAKPSRPEWSRPPRPADFEAEIAYLTTEEGGRTLPVWSGYRPNHNFGLEWLNDAMHEYSDGEPVPPGSTVRANLWLLCPDDQKGRLQADFNFTVQEGGRIVGRGKITRVINESLMKGEV